ncbi:MAG: hypothetical protein QOJ40_1011 [Verrucomicrobiota bacterium]
MIIAQGKAAEAAALGNRATPPTSFFLLVWRVSGAPNHKKKEEIILRP